MALLRLGRLQRGFNEHFGRLARPRGRPILSSSGLSHSSPPLPTDWAPSSVTESGGMTVVVAATSCFSDARSSVEHSAPHRKARDLIDQLPPKGVLRRWRSHRWTPPPPWAQRRGCSTMSSLISGPCGPSWRGAWCPAAEPVDGPRAAGTKFTAPSLSAELTYQTRRRLTHPSSAPGGWLRSPILPVTMPAPAPRRAPRDSATSRA